MNMINHSAWSMGRFSDRTLAGMLNRAAALVNQSVRPGRQELAASDTDGDAAILRARELFVQALCEDSNREMDWLWLAAQVAREHERRYCLERALRINPNSQMARRELARLQPVPGYVRRLTGQLR